ncbi:hypothetical protein NQZ68_009299 [Dissostichus eleginoides]|nr:hypothetical protein NQZ68_009299 [Dissostichus eleginoides]
MVRLCNFAHSRTDWPILSHISLALPPPKKTSRQNARIPEKSPDLTFALCHYKNTRKGNEIIALISFQLLRFGGIWETFQHGATDHKPAQSLLPSCEILNSCRASRVDTCASTPAQLNSI